MDKDICVATIVGKHDLTKKGVRRGYIAMLVVEKTYRKLGLGKRFICIIDKMIELFAVGSKLVRMLVDRMMEVNCSQVKMLIYPLS